MTNIRNETHAENVRAWEAAIAKSTSPENMILLFVEAIRAVEIRSASTLSSITVMVVADRALCELKEKFEILQNVKNEIDFMDLSPIVTAVNIAQVDRIEVLRELLIEILSIFGNITAEILNAPLLNALASVTGQTLTKKDREQS